MHGIATHICPVETTTVSYIQTLTHSHKLSACSCRRTKLHYTTVRCSMRQHLFACMHVFQLWACKIRPEIYHRRPNKIKHTVHYSPRSNEIQVVDVNVSGFRRHTTTKIYEWTMVSLSSESIVFILSLCTAWIFSQPYSKRCVCRWLHSLSGINLPNTSYPRCIQLLYIHITPSSITYRVFNRKTPANSIHFDVWRQLNQLQHLRIMFMYVKFSEKAHCCEIRDIVIMAQIKRQRHRTTTHINTIRYSGANSQN